MRINRTEICRVDQSEQPAVLNLTARAGTCAGNPDHNGNVKYKKEIFYSPSEKRTYVGELPAGVAGEFGPGIRSLVCTLKYVANMSQPKIQELLENCGILISQSTIARILTNDDARFNRRKRTFRATRGSAPNIEWMMLVG